MEDCALFAMVCTSETGRVGCVEPVDTETGETPPADSGTDTDTESLSDAGPDAG